MRPVAAARPNARGEYAKSSQRRKEIIEAAVEVFSESGFRDGGLRSVAERAGITHAGMRHHFPTKVDLLEAVLKRREQDSLEQARRDHPTGVAVLRTWVESVTENSKKPILIELEAVLSAEAISSDHPAHEYFQDRYRRAEEILTRAFRTAYDRGQLREGAAPEAAGRLVLATTLGLQSLWLRDRSFDVGSELRAHVETFLNVEL